MINLLLEAFLVESKTKNNIDKLTPIIAVVSTLSYLLFAFLYLYNLNIIFGIISIISFIFFLIYIAVFENMNLKRYKEKFDRYNKRLDKLKEILQNFKYSGEKNWYSKDKIKYLIDSIEKNIEDRINSSTKLTELCKTMIFPIIAFVAGVISNKSSINQAVELGIIAIIFLAIVYSLIKISTFFWDLVFKSSAIHTMKFLLSLLQDLLVRDFN